jgi:hypothetical protein
VRFELLVEKDIETKEVEAAEALLAEAVRIAYAPFRRAAVRVALRAERRNVVRLHSRDSTCENRLCDEIRETHPEEVRVALPFRSRRSRCGRRYRRRRRLARVEPLHKGGEGPLASPRRFANRTRFCRLLNSGPHRRPRQISAAAGQEPTPSAAARRRRCHSAATAAAAAAAAALALLRRGRRLRRRRRRARVVERAAARQRVDEREGGGVGAALQELCGPLVDAVVCEVHERLRHVLLAGGLVRRRAPPHETLAVQVRARVALRRQLARRGVALLLARRRDGHRGDEHVEAEVELEPPDQQRIIDVALHEHLPERVSLRLLSVRLDEHGITAHHLVERLDLLREIDAAPARERVRLSNQRRPLPPPRRLHPKLHLGVLRREAPRWRHESERLRERFLRALQRAEEAALGSNAVQTCCGKVVQAQRRALVRREHRGDLIWRERRVRPHHVDSVARHLAVIRRIDELPAEARGSSPHDFVRARLNVDHSRRR